MKTFSGDQQAAGSDLADQPDARSRGMWALAPNPGRPRLPAHRRAATKLICAALAACVLAALCYLLMVHTTVGQRFDTAAAAGATQAGSPHFGGFADSLLGHISEHSLKLGMLVLFAIGALRGRPTLGVAGAAAAGGSVATVHVLRFHVLDRASFAVPGVNNTFPSEHVAAALALALTAVLVCPPFLRSLAAVVAAGLSCIIATQVQIVGWHRASDAIGAALVVFAFTSGLIGVLGWIRPVAAKKRPSHHWWAAGILAGGSLLATGMAAVVMIGNPAGVATAAGRHKAYVAGLDLTIAVVAILFAGFLILVGTVDFGTGWRRAIRSLQGLGAGDPSKSS